MKMKKTLLFSWVLAAALLAAAPGFPGPFTSVAFAADAEQKSGGRVFDEAGLFTEEEKNALEEQLRSARKDAGVDMTVLTIDDAGGKTSEEFADDYYDSENLGTGAGDDGALFLIDMDNREIYISTHGSMTRLLTDERLNEMLDNAYYYASGGEYAECASSMIQDAGTYAAAGIVEGQYNYDRDTGKVDVYHKRSIKWYEFLIALAAAGAVAVMPCLSTIKQYKMEAEQKQALNYHLAYRGASAFAFTVVSDHFINKMVSQRQLPRNPGGMGGMGGPGGGSTAGRSTVHTSSSGRTHGGGGRKF